jgi:tetratricopeptide (TPR) repeat protein/CHAT domain-containing protein
MGLIASVSSRFALRAILTAVLAASLDSFATPGLADNQGLCAKGRPDETIAACTRIIDSGQLTGNRLGLAYANRGRAWAGNKEAAHAAADYKEALRLDPASLELLGRVRLALLANGEIPEAIGLAERVVQSDKNDRIAHLVLGVHALKQERYIAARSELAQSIRGPVTDLAATLLSAWTMVSPAEAEAASSSIDRLAGADWYATFKDLHAALILDLAGRRNESAARYERAYKRDATMLRLVQSYGSFLSREERTSEALKVFAAFNAILPRHPLIIEAMDELNAGKKLPPMIDTPQAGAAEVLYGLGAAIGRRGDQDLALIYLQLALYLALSHPLALLSLGDLYEAMKKPELAIKTYERVPANSPLQRSAQIQLAINLDTLDRTDEAKARLQALIVADPGDVEAIIALGNVLRARRQFAECAEVYSSAIAAFTRDEKANWLAYYYRGICYERARQWPKAEADLKKALELYPEQPLVLNYLGFSWIDQGAHLDEGMSMIKRAAAQRAGDGYIIDSLGWAYYRLGDFNEAVRQLKKAAELKPDDATINDHLGDAYWRVGHKPQAQQQWARAGKLNPEPEQLSGIESKLQSGLPGQPGSAQAAPKPAPAQSDLDAIHKRYAQLYAAGDYGAALVEAQNYEAVVKARFGSNHLRYAYALNSLGLVHWQLGKYAQAEEFYKRALAIDEKLAGAGQRVAIELDNLGLVLREQGKYAEAEAAHKRALAIFEKVLGPSHVDLGYALHNLAGVYKELGKYAEAAELHKRALAIVEKARGANHPDVATTLDSLASVYQNQGRYADAEGFYRRALAIREKALGKGHPEVAKTVYNLGLVYRKQGRFPEAEALIGQVLEEEEKLGKDRPAVATTLSNLAAAYEDQGKYAEAEALYKRALAIEEQVYGADNPHVADTLGALAILYQSAGKYADARRTFERALAVRTKVLGPDHPDVAWSLHNLAALDNEEGKYAEAEDLYKRALAIQEKAFGAAHPSVATTLSMLGLVYVAQGKNDVAEQLTKRVLAIREKTFGTNHIEYGIALNNLALIYSTQQKYADAEPLYQRALSIAQQVFGADDPEIATAVGNLGDLYQAQGKFADAQQLYEKSLAIREKILGPSHPQVAHALVMLAGAYFDQGKRDEAERVYQRALAIHQNALGENHPFSAVILQQLANLYQREEKPAQALDYSRRALAAIIAHAGMEREVKQHTGGSRGLIEQRAIDFRGHVVILNAVRQQGIEPADTLAPEAFEAAQWAVQPAAATALAQMAAREVTGTSLLAQLVRERQDLERQWHGADQRLNAALGRGDADAASRLRRELSGVDGRLKDIDARLQHEFPDYAGMTNPKPLSVAETQRLIGPDEALVFWIVARWESYVFALTHDRFAWKSIPLGREAKDAREAIGAKVAALRRGLDVDALRRGLERVDCTQTEAERRGLSRHECGSMLARECEEADKRGLARADCSTSGRELFDLGLAHELYDALLGPVEPLIKDKKHLIVVPSGALTALPFHLLVTQTPAPAASGDLAAYREAQWLIRRQAVSVLPSVASLKALRMFARKDEAKSPMVGFGDPVFNADDENKPAQDRAVVASRSYSEFWKGVDIDRTMLGKALPRLPETAAELREVAKNLGAPENSIHLRADASESTVKRTPLADYRVVYFATHGLVAGEIKGLAEPSLALTLPSQPSDLDDGLLTASEVAQLKLNADWVVLSACNTIAGDKPGAEALSGLARAFFYAGARALLVSHWAVESNAAMRLTTSTFDILKSDPALGRAAALRRAMLAYMNDTTNPLNAYPALWAPFVVVGEGAAR